MSRISGTKISPAIILLTQSPQLSERVICILIILIIMPDFSSARFSFLEKYIPQFFMFVHLHVLYSQMSFTSSILLAICSQHICSQYIHEFLNPIQQLLSALLFIQAIGIPPCDLLSRRVHAQQLYTEHLADVPPSTSSGEFTLTILFFTEISTIANGKLLNLPFPSPQISSLLSLQKGQRKSFLMF